MRKLLRNNGLFCLLALFFAGVPAHGQADEDPLDRLFTIQSIKVDETARRASDARTTALAVAEQQAYATLLRKLTQPEGRAKLPELDRRQIQAMISGIEVVSEQSSSRRYLATLNVRFEPGIVSQFLAQHQVPHVLGTGRGILVLHAHSRSFANLLWERDASLEDARSRVDWVNRIRQYVFPAGQMRERAQVTFEEVAALDQEDATVLARQYGVNSVLLTSSSWDSQNAALTYRFLSSDGDVTGEGVITDQTSEVMALAAMYDTVLEAIDSAWRAQLLVDTGVGGEMDLLVPTIDLESYNQIQSRLSEVSLVGERQTIEIGMPFSKIHIRYTGREDQLALALRYAGLSLGSYGDERLLALRDERE